MARKKIPDELIDNRTVFRFLQKSYDEAFALLVFTRDYFALHGKTDKQLLPKDQQLIYTLTLSTITTQLTSVMAWLLMCKAVENGEISYKKIQEDDFSMPVFTPGIGHEDSCFAILNQTAQELLEKSHALYTRIKRMEEPVKEHFLEI